jgi:small-conductance mechanosensitive channel
MRVKLQYSVELEEVPSEARPLFSRANAEIQDAGDHMCDIFIAVDSGSDYDNVLDSIEQARKNLSEADFRLGDAEAILRGYLQAKHTPQQEPQPSMDFEQLQEQLETLSVLKDALPDAEGEQDE